MSSLALSFNNVNFSPVEHDNQIWLTASELAKALGYARPNAVTQIFDRNSDEFPSSMTQLIPNPQSLNLRLRVFSLRGCHLIAMFSKTAIAKTFRKWVLDILDKEVGKPVAVAKTHKEERAPLTSAVNLLVAKTKHLNYSEAYKLVHQRFNVEHIEEIPHDALPVAVEYVHHLIALYSKVETHQFKHFGKTEYELVRELAEAILQQNSMMNNVWNALKTLSEPLFEEPKRYITYSNMLAREVGTAFDFRTNNNEPLVTPNGDRIYLSTGAVFFTNPKFFKYLD